MPYVASKDTQVSDGASRSTFGGKGRTNTDAVASDTVDLDPYAKAIMLLTDGTLKILPVGNDDSKPIAWTGTLSAGFIPPYRIRRVFATGTTATFATIDD